jgi:hypothetical protein
VALVASEGRVRRALRAAVALALFVGAGEAAVRLSHPTPRTQVVDPRQPGVVETPDGGITWRRAGPFTDALEGAGCVGARHVVIAGDSILYVLDAANNRLDAGRAEGAEGAADNVGPRLQGMFRDLRPPICIHDVAQPGFGPDQIQRAATSWRDQVDARVVVLGVWKSDRSLEHLGDRWYDLSPYARRPGALPAPWGLWVPDAVGRPLFATSALYAYATLATAPPNLAPATYDAYLALARSLRAKGSQVVLVEHALLEAMTGQGPGPRPHGARDLERAAIADGFLYLALADAWSTIDLTPLRIDPVHLNPAGHRLLAETLAPWVLRALTLDAQARGEAPPDAPR